MNPSDETLMAYVDGELGAAAREQVESALADPEVARRVAAQRALRDRLRATFDTVLAEPVPAQLVALVRTGASDAARGQLLQFPAKQAPRRAWLQWSSLAASFVLGALLWQFGSQLYEPGPLRENHGEFVASGSLARALSGQLAAQQNPSGTVQVGVSFRSKQGEFCRTFRLRGSQASAGLACHEHDDWKVQVLARDEALQVSSAQYRQAASSLPPAVVRAVDDMIAGDPLDSVAEAQARASGWHGKP